MTYLMENFRRRTMEAVLTKKGCLSEMRGKERRKKAHKQARMGEK